MNAFESCRIAHCLILERGFGLCVFFEKCGRQHCILNIVNSVGSCPMEMRTAIIHMKKYVEEENLCFSKNGKITWMRKME